MTELISKHGGYKNLQAFQTTVIIYDLTVDFCRRYIPSHKMKDQLEGAARSGSQNIGEGSQASGTSKQTEIRLVDVARGSLEELKLDMQAYLRQNNLNIWSKEDPRTLEVRKLAYVTNRSYTTYKSYMDNPESAANCLLCLINQACFLLDQLLKSLEQDFKVKGDFRERNQEIKKDQITGRDQDDDEFLKQFNMKRMPNGTVDYINKLENEK